MTPQESELIQTLVKRLKGAPPQQVDADADKLIQGEMGKVPNALYLLTQAVIVQEQALKYGNERITQLENQLKEIQQNPPKQSGGFLGGIFGGSSAPAPVPPPPPPPPPPAFAPGSGGVGSFLRSAAATAAGVVGGELMYDGLRHMFGMNSSGYGGYGIPGGGFLGSGSPIIEETIIINNPSNRDSGAASAPGSGGEWGDSDDSSTSSAGDSYGDGGDYETDDDADEESDQEQDDDYQDDDYDDSGYDSGSDDDSF